MYIHCTFYGKVFHVNSNATANVRNEPSSCPLLLGILSISIQAGNSVHDSITAGQPINFPVDEAIMHLDGSVGQIKVEETLDIGFTNENPLVPQSSLSFYLERLSHEPSNVAAVVIVNHMTICFVAHDGKLFVLDSHLHFPHGAMVGVSNMASREEFLFETQTAIINTMQHLFPDICNISVIILQFIIVLCSFIVI